MVRIWGLEQIKQELGLDLRHGMTLPPRCASLNIDKNVFLKHLKVP